MIGVVGTNAKWIKMVQHVHPTFKMMEHIFHLAFCFLGFESMQHGSWARGQREAVANGCESSAIASGRTGDRPDLPMELLFWSCKGHPVRDSDIECFPSRLE